MGTRFILLVIFQAQLIFSQCPEDCRCSSEVLVDVNCSGVDLRSIRNEDFNEKVFALDLSYTKIAFMKDYVLDALGVPMLKFLNLSHNHIWDIGHSAFFGLSALSVLDLSWNWIDFVEPEVFHFVPDLQVLLLSYNSGMKLPSQPYNLHNLKSLIMDHCELSNIPENFFSEMPKLEHLNLAYNNIKTLPPNVFLNTAHLLRFFLNHNLIKTLNDTVLVPLVKLKVFETQGNPWNCDCNMFRLVKFCARRRLSVNVTCSLLPGGFRSDLNSAFRRNCTDFNPGDPARHESSLALIDIAAGGRNVNKQHPGVDERTNQDFHKSTMSLDDVVQINIIMMLAIVMTFALCVSIYVTKHVMVYLNNKYNREYVLV